MIVAADAASAAGYSSEATIEVSGGPNAGTHTLKVDDVGCELRKRLNGHKYFNGNFGLQSLKDPKKLGFVMVTIRNADGPGSPAVADFEASVTFGPVMRQGSTFYMAGTNPTAGRTGGPGKVLLTEHGKTAQVTLDLQPQAGVAIKGKVSCTIIQLPT